MSQRCTGADKPWRYGEIANLCLVLILVCVYAGIATSSFTIGAEVQVWCTFLHMVLYVVIVFMSNNRLTSDHSTGRGSQGTP